MKVTKYPQSCLLLEKNGQRIVIDPGGFFTAEYVRETLGNVKAVLITHRHGDHFDNSFIKTLIKEGVEIFSNREVADLLDGIKVVENGKSFVAAGFDILPYDLPHCKVPKVYGEVHNTGYIIDGTFFHPGDGIEAIGLQVHDLAVPVAGPDISFYRAMEFIKSTQARRVIPIHFNEHGYPANMLNLKIYTDEANAELIALEDGESVELLQP